MAVGVIALLTVDVRRDGRVVSPTASNGTPITFCYFSSYCFLSPVQKFRVFVRISSWTTISQRLTFGIQRGTSIV